MPLDSTKQPRRDREFWDRNFQKRSNPQNATRQAPKTKVRGDPWQSVSALQLGLRPRSFDELHTERVYLLEMLQQHDQRAVELFQRVPVVEEQISRADTTDDQRRAKKHRGWLRHRIVDTVEEEKTILARLSELHVEIQCRERWYRVERDRQMRIPGQQHTPDHAAFPPPPPPTPSQNINPPCPASNFYRPPYGYTEAPDMQYKAFLPHSGISHGNDWAIPTVEYSQNESEATLRPGTFEIDGTPIDSSSGNTSRNHSEPLEENVGSRPRKMMSMPSLGHISVDDDQEHSKSCP
ncbi:hypothetical protein F4819DRAFT_213017 [Hypoxylon fuscum]|nr:hypothetical protein F4819DRAFT_213017 [Hypoxylon fuscum]